MMNKNYKIDDLENVLLSALFVSQEGVDINTLYKVINNTIVLEKRIKKISKEGIEKMIDSINKKMNLLNLPFFITQFPNGKYDLHIKKESLKYVENLAPHKEFSRGVLQTLALIAYKSPIKQKEVIEIRGQHSYDHIKELYEKGFIKIEKDGNYNVLKITRKFLDYFGLKNEKELKEFFKKRFIEERDFEKKL